MRTAISISEIFGPTIQGEGPLIGVPTIFVRTGGCDFRCSWCDSMHAVDAQEHGDSWEDMSAEDVFERIMDLSAGYPMLVSLSGGNPALQPLERLIDLGSIRGYTFALETQGTVAPAWLSKLNYLILSPKGPSSGMAFNAAKLNACVKLIADDRACLKVVVFDEADYQFARELAGTFPDLGLYLQSGTAACAKNALCGDFNSRLLVMRSDVLNRLSWLIERAKQDHWNEVRILPQLHVLLWGDQRGV